MNKHLPSNIKPRPRLRKSQVITFLQRDRQELHNGSVELRRLTTQSAATLRDTLVQAANAHADSLGLSLVSTRHEPPRFYVDGEELVVNLRHPLASMSKHRN